MQHSFGTVFLKEFTEIIRDRKSLAFMILIPTVMMPLLLTVATSFTEKAAEKAESETIAYALRGEEYLPELAKAFAENPKFERVNLDESSKFRDEIRNETIKLGIVIPEEAGQTMATGDQASVAIYYNNANIMSRVKNRADHVITSYSEQLRSQRLAALGLDRFAQESVLQPVVIEDVGTADMREVIGERIGGMLPYFFILFCFMGALFPAIDLGAGEKERATLETLLLTPVSRNQLVLGKFLVVFCTGVISAVLSLGSLGDWLLTKGQMVQGILGDVISSVGVLDLSLIAAMMLPISAIFAALLLSISIYGRNFKEAQGYATPLNMLVIVPAMLAMVPGVELTWKWALVPITNIALAMKELVKGTMDYQMLTAILGSSTLIALALLFFCTRWFYREDVLFRS